MYGAHYARHAEFSGDYGCVRSQSSFVGDYSRRFIHHDDHGRLSDLGDEHVSFLEVIYILHAANYADWAFCYSRACRCSFERYHTLSPYYFL